MNQLEAKDSDGLVWDLKVDYRQRPHPEDHIKLIWEIRLQLKTSTNTALLLQAKTLDAQKDRRLVSFFYEGEPIFFSIRPLFVSAIDELDAIKRARDKIPEYLEKVRNKSLHDYKRKAIGEMVEKKCRFDARSLT